MYYVTNLNHAIDILEKSEEPIALTLVKSDNECFRSSIKCSDEDFQNVFYIKNNMDQAKNIKLTITTRNENHEELSGHDSFEVSLDAGEYKLLETKHSNDKTSKWEAYTFETKDRVASYKYRYTSETSY